MKGRKWKCLSVLCMMAMLAGMAAGASRAQAVDGNRILSVTEEGRFTFDEETGLITAYQNEEVPEDVNMTETVVIPVSIRGIRVRGLAGTFMNNQRIQEVIIPDTLEVLGDESFYGCTSLDTISVYRTEKTYTEEQVMEQQNQSWNQRYLLADKAMLEGEIVFPTIQPIASTEPDGPTPSPETEVSFLPAPAAFVNAPKAAENEPTDSPLPSASAKPSGTPNSEQGDQGGMAYFEIVSGGRTAMIPASLKELGERVFNDCAIAAFDVMEGSDCFSDSGEKGHELPEGAGASLLSADGRRLYRMAPRFRDEENSLTYRIPEGVEEILPYAGQGLGWHLVEVSTTVKTIDDYAFFDSGLLGVEFQEVSQTETIGEWAFAYNENMTIVLPPSVKTIGEYCFAYMTNRTPDISQTQITVIPEYTFEGCENLHEITMPATLQVIEPYAFAGNDNLNEVIFTGSSLTSIGEGTFQDCPNLHSIDIPEGVTTIEPNTFDGCQNLNTIILPEGLEEIKDGAFADCPNIHTMVIPSTVTEISPDSFQGTNTQDIDTSKNVYAQGVISGKAPTTPAPSVSPAPIPTPIPTPAPVVTPLPAVGEQVTIGKLVYRFTASNENGGAVKVVRPKSKAAKKINIPASVTYSGRKYKVTAIAAGAFRGCKKLKGVTIGTKIKSIGGNAFKKCKKLKKITIKTKKLKKSSVGSGAFGGIQKKAVVKVPKSKFKAYKKLLRKKGLSKKAKIRK